MKSNNVEGNTNKQTSKMLNTIKSLKIIQVFFISFLRLNYGLNMATGVNRTITKTITKNNIKVCLNWVIGVSLGDLCSIYFQ